MPICLDVYAPRTVLLTLGSVNALRKTQSGNGLVELGSVTERKAKLEILSGLPWMKLPQLTVWRPEQLELHDLNEHTTVEEVNAACCFEIQYNVLGNYSVAVLLWKTDSSKFDLIVIMSCSHHWW